MNVRKGLRWLMLITVFLLCSTLFYIVRMPDGISDIVYPPGAIPFAILGDSDSHSYHDDIYFTDEHQRGGDFHTITYQWSEILDRLRGEQLYLGPWGENGTRRAVALVRQAIGLPFRMPRKEDYRFNFAMSGAGCDDLTHNQQQLSSFLQIMEAAPAAWAKGVVLLRIGVNDLATTNGFSRIADDENDARMQTRLADCITRLTDAVAAIKQRSPTITIVLVGLFNNSHWAPNHSRWQDPEQQRRLAHFVAQYDAALRSLTQRFAATFYFDDNAWFALHWGGRDANGKAAYREVVINERFRVSNTQGDAPQHATLKDGHAGLVWNLLWAQAITTFLHEQAGKPIAPIADKEAFEWLTMILERGAPKALVPVQEFN